jgi:signal transduction histidine kinase
MARTQADIAGSDAAAESSVAAAAQRALGCDALIIDRGAGGIGPIVDRGAASGVDRQAEPGGHIDRAAAVGIAEADADALGGWLAGIEAGLAQGIVDSEIGPDSPAHALGFRGVSSAAAEVDGDRLGTVHALFRRPARADPALLLAFAAHCAVVLAHTRLRRRAASLVRRAERTQAFDKLVPSVSDFAELIPRVDAALAGTFGEVRCGVMVWDPERNVLQMVAGSFGAPGAVTASYQVNPGDLRSNAARVFELQRPYLTNHAHGDPAVLQDYAAAFSIERLLSVPLSVGDRAIGVLHVSNKPTAFGLRDIEELERLAPRIAVAVEMTRLLLRTRRQQQLDAVLSRVATAIAHGHASPRLLRDNLGELLAITDTAVIVLAPRNAAPIVTAVAGDAERDLVSGLIDEARGLQGERAHVVRPHGAGDPGSAVFHVPVRLGERQLGTLSAHRNRGERFDADERQALARMGNLASLAWGAEEVSAQQTRLTRLEERQRIADDLHDDVAQLLFAAQMQLEGALEQDGVDPAVAAQITRARELITRGDTAIRDVIAALSKPAPTGLADQLRELAEGIEEEFEMPIRVEITESGRAAAAETREVVRQTMSKVARESLVNVAKHAGPCEATLRLDADDGRLLLKVVDDGVGVAGDADGRHHGLSSLRRAVARRGGSLEVRDREGGGTTVAASLPLASE